LKKEEVDDSNFYLIALGLAVVIHTVLNSDWFALSFLFLLLMSLEDWRDGAVSLKVLFPFFLMGVVFASAWYFEVLLFLLLMVCLHFSVEGLGGADVIIAGVLLAIMPFDAWIVSMLIGTLAGLVWSKWKRKDSIRLIPFLTIGVICAWLVSFLI
jgi:hypothetical protein